MCMIVRVFECSSVDADSECVYGCVYAERSIYVCVCVYVAIHVLINDERTVCLRVSVCNADQLYIYSHA